LIELLLLWSFEGGWLVSSLAPGPLLGVATFAHCFYLLNWTDGAVALKGCPGGQILRASYAFGKYAFLGSDGVYLVEGKDVRKLDCNCTYVLPLKNGVAACTRDGKLVTPRWTLPISCNWLGTNGTVLFASSDNSTYIIDLNDGGVLAELRAGGAAGSACGSLLALTNASSVTVFNGTESLWTAPANWAGEPDFSDDCKYLAYPEVYEGRLNVVEAATGKVVLRKTFYFSEECQLTLFSVAWKGHIIALGRGDGWVEAYTVRGLEGG